MRPCFPAPITSFILLGRDTSSGPPDPRSASAASRHDWLNGVNQSSKPNWAFILPKVSPADFPPMFRVKEPFPLIKKIFPLLSAATAPPPPQMPPRVLLGVSL